MPFQINLDSCILESSLDYPNILGNLMVNDYIRGLDPQKDRIGEEAYLALFSDLRDVSQRMHFTRGRYITQFSCNNSLDTRAVKDPEEAGLTGYVKDPRGAGLAYSKWLSKWYVGMGRCKRIFHGLMDNIHRMKTLLIEDGIDHEAIFTQKLEEAIIKSFCRCVLPTEIGVGDNSVEWYRNSRPHNKVHSLELCFSEKLLPFWNAEPIGWEDPGVGESQEGITIPLRQVDTFMDNQVEFMKACFGNESAGPPGGLDKQPVCKLIQRVLNEAVGSLVTVGLEHETPFDLQRTYIQELDSEEMYSVMVCIGTYFHIEEQQVVPVDSSLKALEGIALLHPGDDIVHLAMGTSSPVMGRSGTDAGSHRVAIKFADLLELHRNFDGTAAQWGNEEMRFLMGVRTDLKRLLQASGWRGPMSGFSFMVNYAEGEGHYGVEEMILHPVKNLSPGLEKWKFWPDGVSRGKVPIDTITEIKLFNKTMVNWANRIRGFQSIQAPEAEDGKNSNLPAPVRPEAVRAVDVEVPIEDTEWGYKRTSPEARSEPELHEVRVDLSPAAKVKFFSDEPREDPDPPKEINSQVWVWGLLILLILTVVTYRNRF